MFIHLIGAVWPPRSVLHLDLDLDVDLDVGGRRMETDNIPFNAMN